MRNHNPNRRIRSFGVTVGGVFLVIAFWPMIRRGQDPRLWALALGAGLMLPGLLAPAVLKKPYELWMRLAHVLGWINTKIILSLMFYLVFTPLAVILRLIRHDPMNRSFVASAETYRVDRQPRNASHMWHQF